MLFSVRIPLLALLACAAIPALAACSNDSESTEPPPPPDKTLVEGIPPGWSGNAGSAEIGLDLSHSRGGDAAAYVTATTVLANTFATMTQSIRADQYRGKRLRWSGWVQHSDLTGDDIGLWMRVDGPGEVASFDNMHNRSLSGSADWHQVSVVLDVPENAIGIALGVLMDGKGTLLIDDLHLEVVGLEVPTTNLADTPQPGPDSASVTEAYARQPDSPVNLDFEDVPAATQ